MAENSGGSDGGSSPNAITDFFIELGFNAKKVTRGLNNLEDQFKNFSQKVNWSDFNSGLDQATEKIEKLATDLSAIGGNAKIGLDFETKSFDEMVKRIEKGIKVKIDSSNIETIIVEDGDGGAGGGGRRRRRNPRNEPKVRQGRDELKETILLHVEMQDFQKKMEELHKLAMIDVNSEEVEKLSKELKKMVSEDLKMPALETQLDFYLRTIKDGFPESDPIVTDIGLSTEDYLVAQKQLTDKALAQEMHANKIRRQEQEKLRREQLKNDPSLDDGRKIRERIEREREAVREEVRLNRERTQSLEEYRREQDRAYRDSQDVPLPPDSEADITYAQKMGLYNRDMRQKDRLRRAMDRIDADGGLQLDQAPIRGYIRRIDQLRESMRAMREAGVRTRGEGIRYRELQIELRETMKDLVDTNRAYANKFNLTIHLVEKARGAMLGFASSYLSFGAMATMLYKTVDIGQNLTELRQSFLAVSESAEEADASFYKILKHTKELGQLDVEGAATQYKKLRAAAAETALSVEEVDEAFQAMQEASIVFSMDADRIDNAFQALNVVMTTGNAAWREIDMRFAHAIPGVIGIVSRELGVTQTKFTEMLKAGTVGAETFTRALTKGLHKAANESGALDKMMETSKRRSGEFWAEVRNLSYTMFDLGGVDSALAHFYKALTDNIEPMHDFAEILGYTISVAIDGAAHVIKAISFISKTFGYMFSWLNEGIQATIAKALIFGVVTSLVAKSVFNIAGGILRASAHMLTLSANAAKSKIMMDALANSSNRAAAAAAAANAGAGRAALAGGMTSLAGGLAAALPMVGMLGMLGFTAWQLWNSHKPLESGGGNVQNITNNLTVESTNEEALGTTILETLKNFLKYEPSWRDY